MFTQRRLLWEAKVCVHVDRAFPVTHFSVFILAVNTMASTQKVGDLDRSVESPKKKVKRQQKFIAKYTETWSFIKCEKIDTFVSCEIGLSDLDLNRGPVHERMHKHLAHMLNPDSSFGREGWCIERRLVEMDDQENNAHTIEWQKNQHDD